MKYATHWYYADLKVIDQGSLKVRTDRFLYSDVGVRQNLLNLLMCYDPAYLKMSLEVIYHQILVFSGSEEANLSKFVEKVRLSHHRRLTLSACCSMTLLRRNTMDCARVFTASRRRTTWKDSHSRSYSL